ncbi:hypothetical protein Vadar_026299 [Vaccinium darrowii]|uniref:Uncharacterized protein n=1 Tax=Vaccinium darrowii TaxID=229202 RepID=A0ACB7ZEZ1_9ERIC|nr:hypothetical protein Vadar_026299 [Vaccinium darrowii]
MSTERQLVLHHKSQKARATTARHKSEVAAEDAGDVIEHGIRLSFVLKQLKEICIKQITLCNMDVIKGQQVDELEYARGNRGFPDGRDHGVRSDGGLGLEHDAVELGHVELVGGGAGLAAQSC